MRVLKHEYVEMIKSDPLLYGKVGHEIGVAATSLLRLLYNRDKRLTQAGVLRLISEATGKDFNEIMEDVEEEESNINIKNY